MQAPLDDARLSSSVTQTVSRQTHRGSGGRNRPRTSTAAVSTCFPGEEGQTTVVLMLILATFLFGFIALGIDVQVLFHARRQAQAAADAAAIAAAEESSNGGSYSAAVAAAKLNGFDTSLATNPAVITVGTPRGGNYSGSKSYIEVDVSQPVPTIFAQVITNQSTVSVMARAVAGIGRPSPTCVCLEGPSGTDLSLSNNSRLTPSGCGTTVDSSSSNAVTVVGGSILGGLSIGSVSTNWDTGSNVNTGGSIAGGTRVVEGIATSCAPPLPAVPTYSASACTADPLLTHYATPRTAYSIGPRSAYSTTQSGGVVCYNSLTIGANGDPVNLNPGIYVIQGGTLRFEIGANNSSNTGGSGVFFYLAGNANLLIDSGANVKLTAATSGTYAGSLFFQDPADLQTLSIQGGSNFSFNGSIYAPSANVTLGNGSNTAINADLVARTLTMNGGGTLSSRPMPNFGTLNTSTAKLGE